MAQANKRRYVFHFDLGNTILMRDYAEGVSVIDNVSAYRKSSELELICDYRWPESPAEAHGVSFLRKRLSLAMRPQVKRFGILSMIS